jgi:hypothetical protein
MLRPHLVIVCIWSLFACVGCKQVFEPKGPFEEKMVLYCILSNTSDAAIVRLYTNYDVPGFDPLLHTDDVPVSDARVTLSLAATQYALHDTVLERIDKSRYADDIHAYVYRPFPLELGKSYALMVTSPTYGTVSASVSVPDTGTISLENAYVLEDPGLFEYEHMTVHAFLSHLARGYLLRALIVYQIDSAGMTIFAQEEVPSGFLRYVDGEYKDPVYRQLARRTSSESGGQSETLFYTLPMFSYARAALQANYRGLDVKSKTAVFVLTQVESQLYSYYNIVNGFGDPYTIRVDQPDYTDIQSGLGVFGSFVEQRLSIPLRNDVW